MDAPSRLDRLEALAPLVLLLVFGLGYNEIGELVAKRGSDLGPAIELGADRLVPFVPAFIVPYSWFWGYPVAIFAYLYWRLGSQPEAYRRIFVSLLVLIACCVLLWWWFPVRVGLRVAEDVLERSGALGELVRLTYLAATPWNACPSFHVAGAWFLYRAVQLYVHPVTRVLPVVAALIIASTVLVRIHYVLDIVFGLLISEAIFRLVLRRFEASGALAAMPASIALAGELAVIGVSVAACLILVAT